MCAHALTQKSSLINVYIRQPRKLLIGINIIWTINVANVMQTIKHR